MEMAGLVMGAQVMRSCMWGRGLLGSSSTSPACPERALYRSALLRLAHLCTEAWSEASSYQK